MSILTVKMSVLNASYRNCRLVHSAIYGHMILTTGLLGKSPSKNLFTEKIDEESFAGDL